MDNSHFNFIMYLDFDGVITPVDHTINMHNKFIEGDKNKEDLFYRNFNQQYVFSYKAIEFLNQLHSKLPFAIVMTSSRRFEFSVKEWRFIFKLNGIKPEIVDRTKNIRTWREEEILEYQNRKTFFSVSHVPFIVVDDDSFDLKSLEDKLLLVNGQHGLTMDYMPIAKRILRNQNLKID